MSALPHSMTSSRTAWIAVLVYAAVLTYVLLTPHPLWFLGVSGRGIEDAVDRTLWGYVQHALAYALLGCLVVWASRSTSGSRQLVWILLAVMHGIAAEWAQCVVPHRYADWLDVLANLLGVGLGWFVALLILRTAAKPLRESVARERGIDPAARTFTPLSQIRDYQS